MSEQEALARLRLSLYGNTERPAKRQPAIPLPEMLAQSALSLVRIVNDIEEASEYEQRQGIAFVVKPKGFLVECQKCTKQWTIEIGPDGHFSAHCPNGCNAKAMEVGR